MHTQDPGLAKGIEGLRYEAYTLEKDIAMAAGPGRLFGQVRLYVLISSDLPAEAISLTARCASGGADCLQLRCKHLQDRQRLALGREFVRMCRAGGVLSIINDRVDLAVACEADGVHLGLEDVSVEVARGLQHRPLIVGATTHNGDELEGACREGPTYVAIGPAFATVTKPGLAPAGLGYIGQAVERLRGEGIGYVAIGGITLANVDQVLRAGARRIAVCSAVTAASDPAAVCRQLKEAVTRYDQA